MENYSVILDVREFSSQVKHQVIFAVWTALSPGGRMLLVNDHDPKPLYYQLDAEYKGQFDWTYLMQGPDQWQVEIEKMQAPTTDASATK